jgi:hypothetical protein
VALKVLLDFVGVIFGIGERVEDLRQRQMRVSVPDFFGGHTTPPTLHDDPHRNPRAVGDRLAAADGFDLTDIRMLKGRNHDHRRIFPETMSLGRYGRGKNETAKSLNKEGRRVAAAFRAGEKPQSPLARLPQ